MDITGDDWPEVVRFYMDITPWPDPWRAAMASFLQSRYGLSESTYTLSAYATTLALFFADGRMPWTISRMDVEKFLYRPFKKAKIALGTKNQRLSIIRAFYNFVTTDCVVYDEAGNPIPLFNRANPASAIKRSKPAKVYKQFSESDLRAFFAAIPTDTPVGARNRCLFLAFLHTSRRLSELLQLTWDSIEPALFAGDRAGYVYRWRGKNRQQILDAAELPQIVYEELLRYAQVCGLERRGSDPIFVAMAERMNGAGPPAYPLRPVSAGTVWLACKQICKKAGIPPRSPHSFRHTSARERFRRGESMQSISRLLRHSSLATTSCYLDELVTQEDTGSKLLVQAFGDL